MVQTICSNNKTDVFGSILDYLVNGSKAEDEKIELNIENDIILFPNPSSGLVKVKHNFIKDAIIRIDIYDNTSRKVQSVFFHSSQYETSLDISKLANGVYYYTIHLGDDNVKKGKLTLID